MAKANISHSEVMKKCLYVESSGGCILFVRSLGNPYVFLSMLPTHYRQELRQREQLGNPSTSVSLWGLQSLVRYFS
jgi:hypothetical protein